MARSELREPRRARPKPSRTPEVLDAAVHLFASQGYESASMQEIGEALGLLKGSLYYYVDSKEGLLFEVIGSVHGEVMENLKRAQRRDGDAATRLRAFLEDTIDLNLDRPQHARVFQREFRHLSLAHQTDIRLVRRDYERFFEGLLAEGQRAGIVRSDIDLKLLAVGGLTMMNAVASWYRADGALSREQIRDQYTDLLMAAYLAPAQRGRVS
jgi:TetR/AcrR family transcriptional regulator, cholesterol catabolism regulator